MEFNYSQPTLDLHTLISTVQKTKQYQELEKYIQEASAHPLYLFLTQKEIIPYNSTFASNLQQDLSKKLQELNSKKSPENESENFAIDLQISELYAQVLDKQNFISTSKLIQERNPSSSLKMDIILCKIRIAILTNDKKLLKESYEDGISVVEHGCDWDRRNKFKVYQGLVEMLRKNYYDAGKYFIDSLATFESKELMSYEKCVFYGIFNSLLSFKRIELKEVINNSHVLEAYKTNENGIKLIEAVYGCENFMDYLLGVCEMINDDIFLNQTVDFFVREIKLRIYKQLLESYKSLSIELFCNVLGVSSDYVEKDLCDFIIERRIDCVIDRIDGVVYVKEREETEGVQLVEKGEILMRTIKKNVK